MSQTDHLVRALSLTWTPATTNPTEPGWYCCRLEHSERPVVLWWGRAHEWRHGMQRMPTTEWLGPL